MLLQIFYQILPLNIKYLCENYFKHFLLIQNSCIKLLNKQLGLVKRSRAAQDNLLRQKLHFQKIQYNDQNGQGALFALVA